MWHRKFSFLFLSFLLLYLFLTPAFATKKPYIVFLGSHDHGPGVTQVDFDRVTDTHYELLGSYLESSEKAKEAMIYSYTRHINGFAAMLEKEEAENIANHPNVVSVFLNQGRKLHTTHSWEFMSQEVHGLIRPFSLFEMARLGEDTIIGHIDTGAWPESSSFSEEGMGPIPSRWKGTCQKDETGFTCNRKLIGARYFNKGYAAYRDPAIMKNITMNTARDYVGHGSHTLSTLGGNFDRGASVNGLGYGTAEGGSPRARVATYKVCWPPNEGHECYDADILAAMDAAIHDGVDVLSLSLGGPIIDYYIDVIAIAAFHAVKNGITVVCAAGNSGPGHGSVSNIAPWILTVGASTLDRKFEANVELPNGQIFKGSSISAGVPVDKLYPLIVADQARKDGVHTYEAVFCKVDTIDPEKAKGKLLVCLGGNNPRVEKSLVALEAGAVGMILYNDEYSPNDYKIFPLLHFLPTSEISYEDGAALLDYINSTMNPMAYLHPPKTELNVKPAPSMAIFSSRGPNRITKEILKPDITAPGVNIIAAYSPAASPTNLKSDNRSIPFITMSGTSMSTPHVAGVVGLLKTLHPDWSPSAIKSAIMTTAMTWDNTLKPILDSDLNTEGTPYAYGAGHIDPNKAMDPGLVYDLTVTDYLNMLCASGYNQTLINSFSDGPYKCPYVVKILDFNYPAITIPTLYDSVTLTRRLKNVGKPGIYRAILQVPAGLIINVEPKFLIFGKFNEEKCFRVTVKVIRPGVDTVFGRLIWSDGKHFVKSPIAVGGVMA